MPQEKFVEYEGAVEEKQYGFDYKIRLDDEDPNFTVVFLAFRLAYNLEKFTRQEIVAKTLRHFADDLENDELPMAEKEEESSRQQTLPFDCDEAENIDHPEDEEEDNAPSTTG